MRLPIQLLNQTGITCLSMTSFTSQGTHTFWFFLTKDFGPRKSGILMRIVVYKIMFINLIATLLIIYVFDIVKLREREGQRVDLGRSLKGHL